MKNDKLNAQDNIQQHKNAAENIDSDLSIDAPLFNPTVQLKPVEEEEEQLQMKKSPFQMKVEDDEEEVQMKKGGEEEEEELQMKEDDSENTSQKSESSSQTSLPENVQAKMEGSLDADFSSVNIHSNSSKAEGMGAQAYAQGNDVHFAPGKYSPESKSGQELIGHELTHVVQQRQGRVQPTTQMKGQNVNTDQGLENEADQMGKKAAMNDKLETQLKAKPGSSSYFSSNAQPIQNKLNDGHDLKANRFSKDLSLEAVYDGEKSLSKGSSGEGVKKVQQALIDGGYTLKNFGVDGIFGSETKASVENFQSTLGYKGASINGIIDAKMMTSLDKRFAKEGKAQPISIPSTTNFGELITDVLGGMSLVGKVQATQGFKDLKAEEQSKFTKYIGGLDPFISKPARADFEPKFTAKTFDATKVQSYRDYMKLQPGRLALISSGPSPRKDKRKAYTVNGPNDKKNHGFQSGVADAKAYTVDIDKTTVPVNLPKVPIPANGNYHTADQVAKGLALLHPTSLNVVNRVDINPGANPADPHWAKKYKMPNFRSYMTAGASGVIDVYPSASVQSQDNFDSSLMHETGHTLSRQRFGSANSSKWKNWNRLSKADVIFPSTYATKSQDEDAAESMALYSQVKGNVYEAFVRSIMPNRFSILDTIVSEDE